MATKAKLGGRGGVSQWKRLNTAGDCKRMLAWAVHCLRNGTLDRADALAFGQLGAVLLRAVELADFETNLETVRVQIESSRAPEMADRTTTH